MRQRPIYDVCIIGSGAGGGMAAYVLTKAGARVVHARGGPALVRVERLEDAGAELRDAASRRVDPRPAVRRVRRVRRRLGDRRRAVHARAGHAVQLVARAHARRPHESLGTHLAPLRAGRLPRQDARRPRRRLADQLRRRQAVLRQRRSVHRPVRIERRSAQRIRTASSCRRRSRAVTSCW